MCVAGALRVEADGARPFGVGENLSGGDVHDLGVGFDEPADQPRTRDPVRVRMLACDPLHLSPPVIGCEDTRQMALNDDTKLDTLRSGLDEGCYCAYTPRPSKLNVAGTKGKWSGRRVSNPRHS